MGSHSSQSWSFRLSRVCSLVLWWVYIRGWPCFWRDERNDHFPKRMGTSNAILPGCDSRRNDVFRSWWLQPKRPLHIRCWSTGFANLRTNGGYHGGWYGSCARYGPCDFLVKDKFEAGEREAGKASFVLGLCFISEGAIPFAAERSMRVIPACMAGGALTGALSMMFGAQLMAPHGGLFVRYWFLALSLRYRAA